jgi:ABC-type Na+ efflux pump permease subunit
MNARIVYALARRDLAVTLGQRTILISLVAVPFGVLIVLPVVVTVLLRGFGDDFLNLSAMLDRLPGSLAADHPGAAPADLFAVAFLTRYFAPLFLILPLMLATSTAADSLAGEKERRTLETLLHSPISDAELIVGKTLAAAVPALAVSGGGFLVYTTVADILGHWIVGALILPTATWWVLVLWTAPATTLLGLGSAVLVSARASSAQAANQLAPIVVLPIIALVYSQIVGVVDLTASLMVVIGAVTWLVALVLLWLGTRLFRRTEQIGALPR